MSKSRQERRRQRAKTEAKRLRRFQLTLVGVIPPKGVVGPVERLWRVERITADMFWCATRFAGCYEASLPATLLKARSAECALDSEPFTFEDQFIRRLRLGKVYLDACIAMLAPSTRIWLGGEAPVVLLAAAAHKIAFEEIDEKLRKRRQWARDSTIDALQFLTDHWAIEIEKARKRADSEGHPLV